MKTIGYVRTTITDNDPEEQINYLKEYGCSEIFQESFENDPDSCNAISVESVVAQMNPGETLVVTELSRLGKTTRQLTELTQQLKSKKNHLVSLTEEIDTRNAAGDAYFKLMDALSSMEYILIKERTLVGLKNARQKGNIGGRPKIDPKTIKKIRHLYYERKETIQYIATKCNVSIGTCYKYINLPEEELSKN